MTSDAWTDPDPRSGDFDSELAELDPRYLEHRPGDPDAKLVVLVSVEGEDAERLERIAGARHESPAEVVAALLREADKPTA